MKKQCSNCKWWTRESPFVGICIGLPPDNSVLLGRGTRPDARCSLWKRDIKKMLRIEK